MTYIFVTHFRPTSLIPFPSFFSVFFPKDNQTSILQQDGLPRLVALLHGAALEAKEPALLLLLALSQGHEQQDGNGGKDGCKEL